MTNVHHYRLDNGLTVLLKEVHSAPVISSWVAYRVGSRNERTGQTGISHWVEHMLFKGTERYPAGVLDRLIDRVGGQWNAYTSSDFTTYFETLPSEHIDLALDAEADRMQNALFAPEEVESERTVIISERHGSENSPVFWLREEMRAASFRVHGYHHTILGDMPDLLTMTRDELYAHYRRHYVPSNAVLAIVGAFDVLSVGGSLKFDPSELGYEPSGVRAAVARLLNRNGYRGQFQTFTHDDNNVYVVRRRAEGGAPIEDDTKDDTE